MSAAQNDAATAELGTIAACTLRQVPARRLSRQVAADTVAIGDALSIIFGGLLPAAIYAISGGIAFDPINLLQTTAIASLLAHLYLRFRDMYDTTRMNAFPQVAAELFVAVCCGLLGVLGLGLPLAPDSGHLLAWYAAWLSASFALILLSRMISGRILARLAADGRFDQRIAVFGAGEIARRVNDYLRAPGLGINFIGVYDDRVGHDRLNAEGLSVAGRLDDLVDACRGGGVDRVVIALPQSANARLAEIVEKFSVLPVSTHIVTHIASDLIAVEDGVKVSALGPIGLLDVKKKS